MILPTMDNHHRQRAILAQMEVASPEEKRMIEHIKTTPDGAQAFKELEAGFPTAWMDLWSATLYVNKLDHLNSFL